MPNTSSHYDLAAWRAASSETFGKLEVHAPEASTFWAQLTSTRVGEVSLFDMHTAPHSVKRENAALADAPFTIHPIRRRLRDNVLTVDWESVAPRE